MRFPDEEANAMPVLDTRPHPNQMTPFRIQDQWEIHFLCGECQELLRGKGFDKVGAQAYFATHIRTHTGPANIEWSADGFCQAVRI